MVEFAVLLPILVTVIFGTIECCSAIRLQQRLNVMAYESARIAVLPSPSMANVQQQCDLLSQDDGLTGHSVSVSPANWATIDSGQWVTATVSLPLRANSAIGGWLFPNHLLTQSMSLEKP